MLELVHVLPREAKGLNARHDLLAKVFLHGLPGPETIFLPSIISSTDKPQRDSLVSTD